MHVISQSCVLFLWMHVLTSVKCKDCTLAEFKSSPHFDQNFDTSTLASTYPGGSSVRVPCKIGYTGFFKILCLDTGWTPAPGNRNCEPKPCGHPGDAQFARFRLEVGDDFVFGSEVVYTCNKGFTMISRSNRRRCLANGWDGFVPVCEAQKCQTFPVKENVQVRGDTEEATYGTIIKFSCTNRGEILSGPEEIVCDETGKWSDKPPDCRAIKCDAPASIDHGRVSDNRQEFKENEELNFVCDEGYIPRDRRPSKCTQFGKRADWSPTPECREIKCELVLPSERSTYNPPNKNMFSPGETVEVTCRETDWVSNPQTTKAVITCKDDGEWTSRPECSEFFCNDPTREQQVYNWYATREQKRLRGYVRYSCNPGFVKPRGTTQAQCTRDGWTPKPLCTGTTCYRHIIDNADIIQGDKSSYRNGDRVMYRCLNGDQETFSLTCKQGSWNGIRTCPGVTNCGKPEIQNGFGVRPFDDTLYYSCDNNYKPYSTKAWWDVATCKGTKWIETPRCIAQNTCGKPPVISNGKLIDTDQTLNIVCDTGYTPQNTRVTCENGEWDVTQDLLKTICTPSQGSCGVPPKVENAVVNGTFQKKYLPGSRVTYKCRDKYQIKGGDTITCRHGKWDKVTCSCEQYCEKLQDDEITLEPTQTKERYADGDTLDYRCKAGTKEGTATCTNSRWSKTVECQGLVGCLTPPFLEDGDFLESRSHFSHNERVAYRCQAYHIMEGEPYKTCKDGIWTGEMRCLKPCTVSQDDFDDNNIDFKITGLDKLYSLHGDHMTFKCKPGFERVGDVLMRQQCNDGEMTLPTCQRRQ
ncbi:coagulation factor XIII B chain-like isoform X2 [Melanotaenia boesemani]|uniref:coagulation factor XIII B chain-like isoform X2 n=1 Tax=Melanotaenia boesemani TaxID=1250792 RepID=UPI001C04C41C|nr:coagulation factor XIII B chain-like isoform X2 [Melanotaenia boesemani]